jgi:cyclase
MLTKRIIPCLDVKNGQVVKGVCFDNHEVVGDILESADYYSQGGADELVFYDITASCEERTVDVDWVKKIAQRLSIPFCVAGGIKTLENAGRVLNAGADKISINTPALENPELINQLAERFGTQCVVIGVDSLEVDGEYRVCRYTGDVHKTQVTSLKTAAWIKEVQARGAGEIVLNCMNRDGVRSGYDLQQLKIMRDVTQLPLIASGGAGNMQHFFEVFNETGVNGALAASVFHRRLIEIPELKQFLASEIKVRV